MLTLRLGVDVLVLMHAVLLGGRSIADASPGLPKAKACFWRTPFRFALDEIAALLGFATHRPKHPLVRERYALHAAVLVDRVLCAGARAHRTRPMTCSHAGRICPAQSVSAAGLRQRERGQQCGEF